MVENHQDKLYSSIEISHKLQQKFVNAEIGTIHKLSH